MPRRYLTTSRGTACALGAQRMAYALEKELDRPTSSELVNTQDQKLQHLKNLMFGNIGVSHVRLQVDPPVSLSNLTDPSVSSVLTISTHFNDNDQVVVSPPEEVVDDIEIDFTKAEDFLQLETPIDARLDTNKLKVAYTVPSCTFMSRLLRKYPANRKRLAFIQRRPLSSKPFHSSGTNLSGKTEGKDVALSCQVCGQRFFKQHLFQRHILTHPDPESKIFLCQICGKRFNRADHLNRHSLLHQVSVFKCQQCGDEFDRASHLDRHRRKNHPPAGQAPLQTPPLTPQGKSPVDSFLLPTAGSVQPSGSNLHLLASVATPEASAMVVQDGTADNSLQLMNLMDSDLPVDQERVISFDQDMQQAGRREPERPFLCEVCSHRFIRATHLRRHMRIHTGEKPFTCHICGQRYARGDYLRAHIQAHRRDKIHKCKHCGEVFHDLTRFADHCRLLHRDVDDEFGNPRPPPETSPPPPVQSVTLESTLAYESAEEITVVSMNDLTASHLMPTSHSLSVEQQLHHVPSIHSPLSHHSPLPPHPSLSHPSPLTQHAPSSVAMGHDMIQMTLVNIADPTPDVVITSSQPPLSHSSHYTPHSMQMHGIPQPMSSNSGLMIPNGQLIPDTASEVTILSQPKPLPSLYNTSDPILQYMLPNGSVASPGLTHSRPLHHQ